MWHVSHQRSHWLKKKNNIESTDLVYKDASGHNNSEHEQQEKAQKRLEILSMKNQRHNSLKTLIFQKFGQTWNFAQNIFQLTLESKFLEQKTSKWFYRTKLLGFICIIQQTGARKYMKVLCISCFIHNQALWAKQPSIIEYMEIINDIIDFTRSKISIC